MKITTKSDYAMIMMIELVKQKKDRVLPLSAIANKYHLSLSYLEQLAAHLKKNQLVISKQGVQGGYSLALAPNKISIRNIIEAVGDEISPVECACYDENIKSRCRIADICNAKKPWSILGTMLYQCLDSVSLKDITQ